MAFGGNFDKNERVVVRFHRHLVLLIGFGETLWGILSCLVVLWVYKSR